MNDEQIFELAEKCGFQDDFGRWNFNNDGLLDFVFEIRQALNETPPCKTHPDAPHGFDRNASHSADRYVCECEGWEPEEKNT